MNAHKHTSEQHCTHVVSNQGTTPVLYCFNCSCGTVGRWSLNKQTAYERATNHVKVWSE
jgi:hypothetical protein